MNEEKNQKIMLVKVLLVMDRIQDPRSGIRKKLIPDPEVLKALDPGSGSATLGASKKK
jgi:hypothetical protein